MALSTSLGSSAEPLSKTGLRLFSLLLSVLVLLLLFVGATVKSHEAGLSVPDWPTSYGYSMFTFPMSQWVGGIFYEHVHRLLASGVGFLTVALCVWTCIADSRIWMRWLSSAAVLAVIAQGALGGLTVIYQLPIWISTFHGTLGQIFFCITIFIAYAHSKTFARTRLLRMEERPLFFRGAECMLSVVFLQLIFGNLMRHADAGLAVSDFPTMGGAFLPSLSEHTMSGLNATRAALHLAPVSRLQVAFHLLHRLWALAVVGSFIALLVTFFRSPKSVRVNLFSNLRTIAALLVTQIMLGILVILSLRTPIIASLHLVTGALLLATTMLAAIKSARSIETK